MTTMDLISPNDTRATSGTAGVSSQPVLIRGLKLDSRISRRPTQNEIDKIKRVTAISCAELHGELFVVKGGAMAYRAHEDLSAEVQAMIFPVTDIAEAAQLSLDLHEQEEDLTSLEFHRLAVESGDPVALSMERVLASRGFTCDRTQVGKKAPNGQHKKMIRAAAAVRYAYGLRALRSSTAILTQDEIEAGEKKLAWALDIFIDRMGKGVVASRVYTKALLRAYLRLAHRLRKGESLRSIADVRAPIASLTISDLQRIALSIEYGHSRPDAWSERLLNFYAGSTGQPDFFRTRPY